MKYSDFLIVYLLHKNRLEYACRPQNYDFSPKKHTLTFSVTKHIADWRLQWHKSGHFGLHQSAL